MKSSGSFTKGDPRASRTGTKHPAYLHGRARKNGGLRDPLYASWCRMKRRCFNKNSKEYVRYGAVGITVSPEWMDFEQFYWDMGKTWFLGASLDRIENAKGYSNENCRWVTMAEQARNKTTVRLYEIGGKKLTIPQIASIYQIKPKTLYDRLVRQGLPLERAIL